MVSALSKQGPPFLTKAKTFILKFRLAGDTGQYCELSVCLSWWSSGEGRGLEQ